MKGRAAYTGFLGQPFNRASVLELALALTHFLFGF